MTKATSIVTTNQFRPRADSAVLGGYDFVLGRYMIELRQDDRLVDRIEVGRDEAVKLALRILGLQTQIWNNLTSEESTQVKNLARRVFCCERQGEILERHHAGEIDDETARRLCSEANRDPSPVAAL